MNTREKVQNKAKEIGHCLFNKSFTSSIGGIREWCH